MSCRSRLTRLTVCAKLRAVGWVPWIVLILWGAIAAAGEPLVLRSFGIRIPVQGILAGSLILLMMLLASPISPRVPTARLLANGGLTLLVAAGAGLLSFSMAATIAAGASATTSLLDATWFAGACLPIGAVAASAPSSRTQTCAKYLLMALVTATAVTVLTAGVAQFGYARAGGAVALSLAASALWMAVCRRSAMIIVSHEDRNTR